MTDITERTDLTAATDTAAGGTVRSKGPLALPLIDNEAKTARATPAPKKAGGTSSFVKFLVVVIFLLLAALPLVGLLADSSGEARGERMAIVKAKEASEEKYNQMVEQQRQRQETSESATFLGHYYRVMDNPLTYLPYLLVLISGYYVFCAMTGPRYKMRKVLPALTIAWTVGIFITLPYTEGWWTERVQCLFRIINAR